MPDSNRSPWLQSLLNRARRRGSSQSRRREIRRLFRVEMLEERALLATITWGNVAGGNWNVPSNWVGGVVPAANDDVEIPDLAGTPTITFNTGTISLRSLSINEHFVLAGGTFSATTISQLAGSFNITSGTLSGLLSVGKAEVTNSVTLGDFVVDVGASFNLASNASAYVNQQKTLTIRGEADFQVNSTLTMNSFHTNFVVEGLLKTTGAVINQDGPYDRATIRFSDSGRANASGTSFDTAFFAPWQVIPSLSAANGGSDNVRFRDISILKGTLPSNRTLNLLPIGADAVAKANMRYVFSDDFIVAAGATLNLESNAKAYLNQQKTLTIQGDTNLRANSTLTINSFHTNVNVEGSLNATSAVINQEGPYDRAAIRFSESGSINSSNTAFDISLFVPWQVIPSLSAANGGSDNVRFRDINILKGTLPSSRTLNLLPLGTDAVARANMRYVFSDDFIVAAEAILNLENNAKAYLNQEKKLTIQGEANLRANSTLTINSYYTNVVVEGALKSTSAAVNQDGPYNLAAIRVSGSGTINTSTSIFDIALFAPWQVIPSLSAANGGSDNVRFRDINILGGTQTAGTTLNLSVIGTDPNANANLRYVFSDNFTVAANATLNLNENVKSVLNPDKKLTISGIANFKNNSIMTLNAYGQNTTIFVDGTLDATGSTITQNLVYFDTLIQVSGSGILKATNSTFSTTQLALINNASFDAPVWAGNRFDTSIFVPWTVIQYLSAAHGGRDNIRFRDINILGGTQTAGTTLNLSAIGTDPNANANLRYVFSDNFTVAANATLNLNENAKSALNPAKKLTISGIANFKNNSIMTLNAYGQNTTIFVDGTLDASGSTITQNLVYYDTFIQVSGSGKLYSTNSTFSTTQLALINNASFDAPVWAGNRFDTSIFVPWTVIQYLSAAHGGRDNIRFRDINILGGTQTAGTTLNLSAIGTDPNANANLRYVFSDNFTVAANATLNLNENAKSALNPAKKLTISGIANFKNNSTMTLNAYGQNTTIFIDGTLNTTGATITHNLIYYDTFIQVSETGTLNSINSTFPGPFQNWIATKTNTFRFENGQTFALGNGGVPRILSNFRSIDVQYGSTLTIPQSIRIGETSTDTASVDVSYSSTLAVAGSLLGKTRAAANFLPHGRVLLNGSGTSANPQLVEIMSADRGASSTGFLADNFAYGKIELANNTYARLTNIDVNSVGATGEALYSHTLIIPAGSKLDLNGQKLYVRAAQIATGGLVNGSVVVVPSTTGPLAFLVQDGGPLAFSTPTPGTIDDSQRTSQAPDEWTFTATQNLPVMIQVNPGATGVTSAIAPQLQRVLVELLDSNNNVLKFQENNANGAIVTMQSDNLTTGQAYKIRIRPHSGFTSLTGNYVVTLVESGSAETALSIAPSADSFNKPEGNSGSATFTYNVTRFGELSAPGSVAWTVSGIGIHSANPADFVSGVFPSGVVSFAAFESTKTVTVQVASDAEFEQNEGFVVTLSNPSSLSTISVGTASSVIVNDDQPQLSDLIVESVAPPLSARSSETVTLGWIEKNDGPVEVTGTWSANVKVVNRATSQIVLDRTVPFTGNSIASKASIARSVSFVMPDGAPGTGAFDITITIDSLNNVTESNIAGNAETNNIALSFFASTMADYPELSVASITTSPSVQLSVPFDISWTVLNSGNASLIKPIRDRVYLSLDDKIDASDRLLATIAADSKLPLAAATTYAQSTSVTLPLDVSIATGQYHLLVQTDFANDQFELNETDNIRVSLVSVNLPPLPDLIVESITASTLVVAGQSTEVSWTVKNQGTANASGSWTDRIFLSDDGIIGNDIQLSSFPVSQTILPNGSILRTQSVQIPAGLSGAYRFVVATDIGNTIQEFNNEGNNSSIDDAVITIDPLPSANLIVESVTSLTSNLSTGQPATIEWIVKNIGNASTNTSGWFDRVYLSTDTVISSDDINLGQVQNPSYLNPDENYRNSLTVNLPQDAVGVHHFIVVTDPTNRVSETAGETDNTKVSAATTILLTPPPDLVVTRVTSPSDAFEGEPIIVNFTVRNQGPGPTRVSQWTDQIYLSWNGTTIDSEDVLLKTVNHEGALAAEGAEYSVSNLSVLLPENITSDTAYIIVRTDASQSVYEHGFEGNNDTRTEFPMRIVLRPRPDLAVDTITPVASAFAGQPLSISYQVTNLSLTATRQASWRDSIYLSTDQNLDPQTDMLLGHRNRSGILQGEQSETRNYSFVLPNTLEGSFYIIVSSDSEDDILEYDNANNVLAASSLTRIEISPPDLLASSISTSTAPKAGREMTILYNVSNIGLNPTPNSFWTDAYYLSTDNRLDGNDRLLGLRQRNGVLVPNQVESITTNFVLPPDQFGANFVLVNTDSGDLVYELNNENNVSSLPIFIEDDRPDLRVRSFVPRINNRSIAPGGTLSFDFEVENQGLGPTFGRSWADRVIMSSDLIVGNGDDISLGSFTSPNNLAAGRSYFRLSENLTIPNNTQEGLYRLFFVTDASTDVPEGNEANNRSDLFEFSVTTTPVDGQVSDLQVTTVTVPATANSGDNLPISWTVRNTGVSPTSASSWTDSVWLSTDSSIDSSDILIGNYPRIARLNVNESYTRSIDWPIGIDVSGNYFTIVQTDANNSVAEGVGESNNKTVSTLATNILLSPTADLQVSSVSVPAQAFSGRTVELSWAVQNAGGGIAQAAWADSVYLSLDQILDRGSDIPIGFLDRASNLAAAQSYSATANLMIPQGLGGSYYVFIVTDATNRVYERALEGNNLGISSQAISISHAPPADLVVGSITIPANGTLGQTASISFTITNAGQNLARGGWYDAIYISSDSVWDIDDGYFGRVLRSADVPANTSYTSTLTAPLPGVLPGNYQVIIRSDIRNNLVEDNEANNLKASLDAFATDAPALTLGTPASGTITTNRGVYYRVTVAAGEALAIEFDSANAEGSIELYASFDAMPRRSQADFSALKPFQPDQRIVISSTQGGTYYIFAFGNEVTGGTSSFSILARIVPFSVFDTSFGKGGTAGDRTIAIEGAKFDRSVTASLVDSAGRITQALRYTRTSDMRLYATFDLRGLATGMYTVRLHKAATNETVLVPNSLEVVFATLSLQPISLTRPDTFNRRRDDRPPAAIPVTIAWRNNTLNDIAVPLIHFSATDPFAATLADANAGNTVSTTEFLGFTDSDGPKDILLAGEYGSASFFVKPAMVDAVSPPIDIHYVAEYFYNDAQANYVWDFDLSQLDLSYLSDAEAIEAINAFKQERGNTVGALRKALMEGLQQTGETPTKDVLQASRMILQEVFDRFVASRYTSVVGSVYADNIATPYQGLVLTLSEMGGSRQYSSSILADGSFVFPKLPAASYTVSVSGGAVKVQDGYQISLADNQRLELLIQLENGTRTNAVTLAPRLPSGVSPVTAPAITMFGKVNETLRGNPLEAVLPQLTGIPYRVEMIGDAPLGFSLASDGKFEYLSDENTAFVVHYDLVIPDLETRVGRILGTEIRSRGVIAITLKTNFTRDVRALDPNDILGPVGFGPEKWISASERLPYTIRFENDPKNATSAAQVVRIVQVLDSDLDMNSFQFGDFGFGGREFKVQTGRQTLNLDLDLVAEIGIFVRVFARIDPASREVSWTFSSISPETGADTTNPEDGFLPRNLLPPEGDGFVKYSIRAKRTAVTGSKIDAYARIIFDGNVPIDTASIFNTLDATRPVSVIAATEPVSQEPRLRVKWSGDDGEIGAGLAVFDVYVSENSGRYIPWLQDTKLVNAEYAINASSTYDFVTIAKDNVGNGEAETKLPDVQRPVAFAGGPYTANEGVALILNGSGQDPDPGQTLTYEWDFDFDGTSFQVDSTLQSPSITFSDGPGTRTVGLRVKDNGATPLFSSVSTATVTINNVSPALTRNNATLTGAVSTTFQNSGTWSDVADDLVSLSASLGSVVKNANSTWSWSFVPTVALSNQTVTITARDKDNGSSSVTFTVTALAPTFKPILSSTEPSPTGNRTFVASIDFTKPVTGFTIDDFALLNATASGLVDLGDGKFNVTLQAQAEGLVRLGIKASSVTDAQGGVNIEPDTIAWTYVVNRPPVAQPGGPYNATEGVALTLNGSGQDPDVGQTLSYEWDLDFDGTNFQVESTLQSPSITWNDGPSARTIALRVKDNSILPMTSPIATTTVTIANVAPVLTRNNASLTGAVSTTFQNNGTWSDVADDPVSLSASLGNVVRNANGTWNWSFVPTVALSNQTVTITARDKDNGSSSVTFTVTAIAPTFKPILSSAEPSPTGNRTFVASIDFTKPVTGFTIDDFALLNATASGLVDLGDGKFNVTLQAQAEGLVRLGIKASSVTDAQGGVNVEPDTIAWTYVVNRPPVAQPGGPYNATEGVALTLNGSGQDPDIGQTLSYEWDLDFDGTNFQVESTLQSPSITWNDGPSARTIALRVKDNSILPMTSPIATTTVTIANVAPVLSRNNASLTGAVSTTFQNSGTWSDVADDLVSLSASLGTVVRNADGTWNWSFVPTVALSNQTVTITARDKDSGSSSVTFTVTALAPTFKPILSSTEPSPTGNRTFVASIDFTKPVTGFTIDDFALLNATASGLVDLGGGKFNVTLQAQTEGLVRLGIKASSVTDAQGGVNIEPDTIAWTYIDVSQTDFGDAPNATQSGFAASYPTSLQQNGARHKISSLRLGVAVDAEPNGTASSNATSDDETGNDEDGVVFGMPILANSTQATVSSFTVLSSSEGKLDAWIDFNRDGDWSDLGEQVLVSTAVISGTNLLPFTIPVNAIPGSTFARFRISTAGGLSPTGPANDGEVEDHAVSILDGNANPELTLLASAIGGHELLIVNGMLTVRSTTATLLSTPVGPIARVRLLGEGSTSIYELVRPATNLAGKITFEGTTKPVRFSTTNTIIDTSAFTGTISGLGTVDLTSNGGQEVRLNLASVRAMNSQKSLKVVADKDDTLVTDRQWKYVQSRLENGKLVHGFGRSDAKLDLQNHLQWQNLINRFDVNGDDSVDPLDVLAIINQINTGSGGSRLPAFDPAIPDRFLFLDVDGDNGLSPLDVLAVINLINNRSSGGPEGEGVGNDLANLEASTQRWEERRASATDMWMADFEIDRQEDQRTNRRRGPGRR